MRGGPRVFFRMSRRAARMTGDWRLEPAEEPPKPYRPVRIETGEGPLACRYDAARGRAGGAMVWVGDVGGGWDTPALDLYPRLAEALVEAGLASLRVRFRDPADLHGCVHDVLAGAAFLLDQGVEALGVCGHSFGGAVAIRAAADVPEVRTVVALAPQAHGAEPAAALGPRCSILLIHGTADRVLPADCSRHIHQLAREPKRLVLVPGAGHVLDEAADAVYDEVRAWVTERLAGAAA